MAGRLKVDDVRYELNPTTGMLSVWLYNDAGYYEKRPMRFGLRNGSGPMWA